MKGQEANRLIQSGWQAKSRLRHLNKEQNIATAVSRRPGGLARSGQRILRLLRTLELALQVRHERRNLLAMDDRTLKDLGLNGIAYSEATRPFWDVPLDRLHAIRWRGASRRRRGG